MRPIEFRAWDGRLKVYHMPEDIYSICFYDGATTPNQVMAVDNDEIYDFVLEQYTGLKDCNGKKIFEGDVVQWKGFEVRDSKQVRPIRKRVVKWEYDLLSGLQSLMSCNKTLEVIGNIHEHKHLLEK